MNISSLSLENAASELRAQSEMQDSIMPFEGVYTIPVSPYVARDIRSAPRAFAWLHAYRKDRRKLRHLGAAALNFSIAANFGNGLRADRMRLFKDWCDAELARRGLRAGLFGNRKMPKTVKEVM